jgi:hypothetical protein
MRSHPLSFAICVEGRQKPQTASPDESCRHPSEQPVTASLQYDAWTPSRRRGRADARLKGYLSRERQLRVRSYCVFHRIYEAMELGMHPANLYPRRSRSAPF